ncbi:hypothetical protein N9514_04935, partial [Pseudomonadales bacterium]|nr:hypothetical protein [Pseudomonadales bacterium]
HSGGTMAVNDLRSPQRYGTIESSRQIRKTFAHRLAFYEHRRPHRFSRSHAWVWASTNPEAQMP